MDNNSANLANYKQYVKVFVNFHSIPNGFSLPVCPLVLLRLLDLPLIMHMVKHMHGLLFLAIFFSSSIVMYIHRLQYSIIRSYHQNLTITLNLCHNSFRLPSMHVHVNSNCTAKWDCAVHYSNQWLLHIQHELHFLQNRWSHVL